MATYNVPALPPKAKSAKIKVTPWKHKLVRGEEMPKRVTPTDYAQEMCQSTEERLANTNEMHLPRILELLDMSDTTHHKFSLVGVEQALFQPYPSELVFQNFAPAQPLKLPLQLFNNDKVSRHVRVLPEASLFFSVLGPKEVCSKVAPGMSTTFTVLFTPQENKDYNHRLVFVTDREKFEVLIRAIGPRAIMDFRDRLHLPTCPVKGSTQVTQLVRNIGNAEAKFQLHTQSPFSVSHPVGTLGVDESMEVTVDFNPSITGDHSQDLRLHYHTGEDVYISLDGLSEELDVCLEPDVVVHKDTYISLSSVCTVSLGNQSHNTLHYCWRSCPSQQDEDRYTMREHSALWQQEEMETERFLLECELNPSQDHRLPLLSRWYQERRRRAAGPQLQASLGCITIEPMEGEICPKTTAKFNIVFKPQEAKVYEHHIYCDITGRESRLPLSIQGQGVGPKLQFNYNMMDMQNVVIGDKDCYEVLVSNKGLIDAPFKCSLPDSTFGRCFYVSPEEGVIPPGACHVLEVSFSSSTLGVFCEDLLLTITGQPQPLALTFKGCVIGPTFNLDITELNFGDVAFGFPHVMSCTLSNTSFVPMTYTLRIPGDGTGPPSLSEVSGVNWRNGVCGEPHTRPTEFTLSPAKGTVRAMSNVTIEVTLCSNTVKEYQLALVVDVEGVEEEIMALPVTARCGVPEVFVETQLLDFHRCFLGHPYTQHVLLTNTSDLPACYGLLEQEYMESPSLLVGSSVPRGIIPAHTSVELPLVLRAQAVGRQQGTAHIAVLGSAQSPLEVPLSCVGQGPAVHFQPPKCDFGRVQVLTEVTRTVQLLNQSPIPARFSAHMVSGKSPWWVNPREGELAPEGQLELRLGVHLRDSLHFQDRLAVQIHCGQTHHIPLSATGLGTTIVSNRPFNPSLDLGTHFSQGPCQYHFQLTNYGQRLHRMNWDYREDSISERDPLPPIRTPGKGKVPGRGTQPSPKERAVFSLRPSHVKLLPGCSVDMVLSGSSDSPQVVRERLVCFAILGPQGCFERIMSVEVTCRFVAPVIGTSTKQITFYTEKVAGRSLVPLYERLVLKNVSPLALSMDLSLPEPFSLCNGQADPDGAPTKDVVLGSGMEIEMWVCFNPAFSQDKLSRVVDEVLQVHYRDHSQQDTVALHAEVHFPNLHFSATGLDFGCVLNHTETHRELTVTNCSRLPVSYCWRFLVDQKRIAMSAEGNFKLSTKKVEEEDEEEEEDKEEKKEPENETKEGRGSPKELPLSCHVGMEQVFDICPIYGQLSPGDSQQVTFTFYGHAFIRGKVVAQCHVEEGPVYDLELRGEASELRYSLNSTQLHFGLQLFNHVAEAEVVLHNSGKVGFRFNVLQQEQQEQEYEEEEEEEGVGGRRFERHHETGEDELEAFPVGLLPGHPLVLPTRGYLEAGQEQHLRVFYLPGVPEVFHKCFQLQVAYLPPQKITMSGEGVFPRISLHLPRYRPEESYAEVMQQAKEAVEAQSSNATEGGHGGGETLEDHCIHTYEELVYMEAERRLVKENALATITSLLELQDTSWTQASGDNKWHQLSRFMLPEYVLDFGFVIPGQVLTQDVRITNTGPVAVSFCANHKALIGTGFSADFEKVKNLPCYETRPFTVKFDPRGAHQKMGDISVSIPIHVVDGPSVQVRLCAVVSMPAVTVSTDALLFDCVPCGMCQVITIQLVNHENAPCSWNIADPSKPRKKIDKFMPLHLRKKALQEQCTPPVVFEMVPSSGLLYHRDRVNVQVKFSPAEGRTYRKQLVVSVAQSTQRLVIMAEGKGEEPQLEFGPTLVVELGPCLPFSPWEEAQVTVKNPCSFPVEFYSLEFDTQYLEEDKILRSMTDYDENKVLLLPPRVPREGLPAELLEPNAELCSQMSPTPDEGVREGTSPLSRAIARHTGVDLSPEGVAARNRRGIALIVYGAPQTGKSSTAALLAAHYGAACLTIDGVVTEALTTGTQPAGPAARRLYEHAAAGEETGAAGQIIFPQQLLVDLLAERLQLSDCHRGIVIDGLESVYASSLVSTLLVALRAFNNRKHIYLVDLYDSYAAMTARQNAQREAEEAVQKEMEERERRCLEAMDDMDEEEYDALPEEEKERIRQRHLQQLRQRKQEETERLREEEELRKRNKKAKEETSGKRRQLGGKQTTAAPDNSGRLSHGTNSTESTEPALPGMEAEEGGKKNGRGSNATQEEAPGPAAELQEEVTASKSEDPLLTQYRSYEQSREHVGHVLQHWDRTQVLLPSPLPSEHALPESETRCPPPSLPRSSTSTPSLMGKRTKKEREKEKVEKERENLERERRMADAKLLSPPNVDEEPQPSVTPNGVPSLTRGAHPSTEELLHGNTLPSPAEVREGLPIPPPVTFSVVPFPEERAGPGDLVACDCFTILNPSGPDASVEDKKGVEAEPVREEAVTPLKGQDRVVTKEKKERESPRNKRQPSARRGAKSAETPAPVTPEQQQSNILAAFRWVVPANSQVTLKIGFKSDSPGTFDQTLNFELLGNRRCYQLYCRGVCTYPSICTEATTLFALSKRRPSVEEGLQKTFVLQPGFFEFGPLLCGKTRHMYKERYPENAQRLVIHNISALVVMVEFCFQHDTKATTYLLDPSTMTLKPNHKQELTVWAYPTSVGQIEDSVVCCVKENPELLVIDLSCWGVRPEIELDCKQLHFDRILLFKEESRSVTLHNKTSLPAAWRLRGLEELGEDFSVSHVQGIVPPHSSFCLQVCFLCSKPLNMRKTICLEVSDVENVLGIIHTEDVQISIETYDVDLDITVSNDSESHSEGAVSHLDFGAIRVTEEVKLSISLKNNGRYKIPYKLILERTEQSQPDLASIFTLSSQRGTLLPTDRLCRQTVQILFRHTKEVFIKEQPVLRCQVIEGGETIATFPIIVSVRSYFNRYKITPARDINFGPLVYGCKTSQTFTIDNTGEFEAGFTICSMANAVPEHPTVALRGGAPGKRRSRETHSASGRHLSAGGKARQSESIQRELGVTQTRLTVGVFTVSPCSGTLQPGCQQVVTVDCGAEQLGAWSETVAVDISDRDPSDHPGGIPYRLVAEVSVPGIGRDFGSIFQEHRLCPSSSLLHSEQFSHAEAVYVLDQNKFVFNDVLVGRAARARVRLTNTSKVPCVLGLAIKAASAKLSRGMEAFEVSPVRLCIPSLSHSFAVLTFTPQSMQQYQAVFEAAVEGATSMLSMVKSKALHFDVVGEGSVPSVCVMRPALRDSQGDAVLQFRRTMLGRQHTLPLVLRNDGKVLAQVHIDMLDEQGVFTLKSTPGNPFSSIECTQIEDSSGSAPQMSHKASLRLDVGQQAEFEVSFCPLQPQSSRAKMTVQVEDNQYDHAVVHLAGEAYQDNISLDNLSRVPPGAEVEEGDGDVLHLGDCHVGCPRREFFTMTNHSNGAVLRFQWPSALSEITFSPKVGHLHAGCSKEVSVTFSSSQPVTHAGRRVNCKLSRVEFEQTTEQVADWDDRQRTVQWLTEAPPQQPTKNRVVKTGAEPRCSVVEGSQRDLELRVNVVCDYAKFSCDSEDIHFEDTTLYQTRLHQLEMVNQGAVQLECSWTVLMDPNNNVHDPDQRAVSPCSRASSALTSLTYLMLGDPELPPFTVEPNVGTVGPGASQIFSVRFSPLSVAKYTGRLLCSIPNLQKGIVAPSVPLCGLSLLPHCHFQLEDSDYLTGNRQMPLDPATRVVEFHSVGLSAPTTRRFGVLNPTSKTYSFQWRCDDAGPCLFRCLTPSGTILPGQKVEVCLEYVAEQPGVVESLWSFLIETMSFSVPFLLVGTSREPQVYLDMVHLDLGDILVGRMVENTVQLVNAEECAFHFSVVEASLYSEDQQHSLSLKPTTGTVGPRERLPLTLWLRPSAEGCVRLRPMLKVRGMAHPLALSVKAEGYAMSARLQLESPEDGVLREASPGQPDAINFGKVYLSELSTVTFLVSNLGRVSLSVDFDLAGPCKLLHHLEVKPHKRTSVEVSQQLHCTLCFCPQSTCTLQDISLYVKVKHGPTFTFAVEGSAVVPSLDFSFIKHNFGKCFLSAPGMVAVSKTLLISNKSERGISVDCQFTNTPYLELAFQPHTLPPGGVMEVPIAFYPREERRYHEKLTFIMDGCSKQVVDVLGQGVEMQLKVEDSSMERVNLGSVVPGQRVKKQVALVNHSPSKFTFSLQLYTQPPLDRRLLSFTPTGEVTVKAGGRCVVELLWSPRQRSPPFKAELRAESMGALCPLLTVQGSCQCVEIHLDQDYLVLGAVMQNGWASKRIVMINTGDIGARFHWATEGFPPEVSIRPEKGYICPGTELPFDVTVAPVELSNDKRYEKLSCLVEGSSAPVNLTITASCVLPPVTKEVLTFTCPVRRSHTQGMTMYNPTNQRWSLTPSMEGEHWSATATLILEPHQSKSYRITYRPLTMTTEGREHVGSVFLSFPDGTGQLYSLQGTAEPPKAEASISHQLLAKTQHMELLPVHNWLNKLQRFHVVMEIVKPERPDSTVSLKGPEYMDVPPLAKKDFKLSFFSYKEGLYNIKVTFLNEASGEYLFYLLTFKATPPGPLSTVELSAPVRQTASACVQMENPLAGPVSLTTECKCADISVPLQCTVPGHSKGDVSFEYQPLHQGVTTARLSLQCTELGFFHYDLRLRALPAPPEETIHFQTPLGSSHSALAKIINHSRSKAEYSCKTDSPYFTVEKGLSPSQGFQSGSEVSVEVCFEPHQLGEMRAKLTLSSALGGEYVFPLRGTCVAPVAQGPFSVRAGAHVSIPFKNVFLQTAAFSFQVSNPCFIVKGRDTITIGSKKTHNFLVKFEAPPAGSRGPCFGNLTISSSSSESPWVYYLRGFCPETGQRERESAP